MEKALEVIFGVPGSIPGVQSAFRVRFALPDHMTDTAKLAIFKAQTANVKAFERAWRIIKRSIHAALAKDDFSSAEIHTRLLALTYSAWAEALLSKLIHTPYGFDAHEISQIKSAGKDGISNCWRKCIELALNRVAASKSNHLPNATQTLNRLVLEFVETPSLLRNKLAHGQLVIALNRENTAVNNDLTNEIAELDVVKIDRLHEAMQGLSDIIEAIIESPQKGALRDYWKLLSAVTNRLDETRGYSIADKAQQLKSKRARTVVCEIQRIPNASRS